MSNAKSTNRNNGERTRSESYPAIALFIVFKPSDECTEESIFAALHNEDMEPDISRIRVRANVNSNNDIETAARQLFNVVKDHNNITIQEMLDVSNVYCYENACESSSDADDDEEEIAELLPSGGTRFPLVPCCLVVENAHEFGEQLDRAVKRLESDGLTLNVAKPIVIEPESSCSSSNEVSKTINDIQKVMQMCNHALHKSNVYAKPQQAQITFVKMMDVSSYLHRLMANEALRDKLVEHLQPIQKLLSHPACEIIPQIQFDLDLIEVLHGYCFSIKSRSFIPSPIPASNLGKLSPRAFIPYDHTTPPQPKYFRQGILNSFPDEEVRVNFLNKFFQCLLSFNMPHKVRKLVVAGPRDSGKTSWSNIFHRIIPDHCIASVTKERQFSSAMITNETQLVIVDEWSTTRMDSDLAKCILQGGWMVTAVKHGVPRTVLNNSPYYITANEVPDFGDDDENVRRRIQIFNTKSLPYTERGIDKWLHDNAMDCNVWTADQINQYRRFIPKEELWYETNNDRELTICANKGDSLFDHAQVKRITRAALSSHAMDHDDTTVPVIHDSFAEEVRARRLRRKRRMRTLPESSDEEIDSPDILRKEDQQSFSGQF